MNLYGFIKYATFGIMVFLVLLLVYVIFFTGKDEPVVILNTRTPETNCININDVTAVEYSACYDAFSKGIYFEIKNYNLIDAKTKIRLVFFDYSQHSYELDLPEYNESSFIQIPASRNPLSMEIYLTDNNKKYCNFPLDLPVKYCSADLATEQNKNTELSLISTTQLSNFTPIISGPADKIPVDLVDPEAIWESVCESDWNCGSWQVCEDGVQKRDCRDVKNCAIPTGIPQRVRSCNATCQEDWRCEWSECQNGFSTPSCQDINRCGTTRNKPQKIPCQKTCTPSITCGEWSGCEADYNFLTLKGGNVSLSGKQVRLCTDRKNCVPDATEERSCSLVIDITTKSFIKCGKEYIGIYNSLDNTLLANIEKDTSPDQVNIDLSGERSKFYCDYCFDGVLNGDEEQIDCGGSCAPCSERKVDVRYSQNFFEKILDAFLNFLS